MGFRNGAVDHTTLSRANENRDYRIYEELGKYLINEVQPLYSHSKVLDISIDNPLYALDSTTISTSIILASWALGKYSKGAVKMHTLLDLRGPIPVSIHITDWKWHDSNELDYINPKSLAFYMMDKAYVDFSALYRFHKAGAFWISRPKGNMKYEMTDHREDFDASTGITGDFTIHLVTYKSKRLYPEHIRLVTYYDAETKNEVSFITNNFEISALEVANLYRHRWDIEVFFKWLKQNITVKNLWGFSENAVKTHLWIAIITYLLLAKIKVYTRSQYSITEVASLVRVSLLEKAELNDILSKPKNSIIQTQNFKERSLFDDIE